MSRQKGKFNILYPSFWTDPEVIGLEADQKLFLAFAITNFETANKTNVTGICEISRSLFTNILGLDLKRVTEIIEFFNFKTHLLRYDFEKHVLFLQNFFKHSASYRLTIKNLKEEYDETFSKSPEFWRQFTEKHHQKLVNLSSKASTPEEETLFVGERGIFHIKNLEIPSPILRAPDYERLKTA